jgi:hypothetical protein
VIPVIDLHTHTIYSDGRATPAEIIDHALHLGLHALAITDHNNGRGAREGERIARTLRASPRSWICSSPAAQMSTAGRQAFSIWARSRSPVYSWTASWRV